MSRLKTERRGSFSRWQVSILRGLKERYEVHHGVRLQDAALVSAAQLSHRYIADRFLPDKAIDLVDEAAAKLNIEVRSNSVWRVYYLRLLNVSRSLSPSAARQSLAAVALVGLFGTLLGTDRLLAALLLMCVVASNLLEEQANSLLPCGTTGCCIPMVYVVANVRAHNVSFFLPISRLRANPR